MFFFSLKYAQLIIFFHKKHLLKNIIFTFLEKKKNSSFFYELLKMWLVHNSIAQYITNLIKVDSMYWPYFSLSWEDSFQSFSRGEDKIWKRQTNADYSSLFMCFGLRKQIQNIII